MSETDEAAMRAFVSRQWASDWDSPEDAVYDEPSDVAVPDDAKEAL